MRLCKYGKSPQNRVYILSTKHTYRPIRAGLVFVISYFIKGFALQLSYECFQLQNERKIFHVFVDSKCTYTRDGKRKGETEYRTEESTKEGTEAENKGNISLHFYLLF